MYFNFFLCLLNYLLNYFCSKSQIFEVNPLVHDKIIEKDIKRVEKARIERKFTELQKRKGLLNLKGVKNLDSILLEEELPAWDFTIERRTNKDTIEMISRPERRTKSVVTRRDFGKTLKNKSHRNRRDPLLNIEVNIDDNNRVEKLEIYSNDDPMQVADTFCATYGLSEEKKVRLQKIIEEKLNENIGSTSNRS